MISIRAEGLRIELAGRTVLSDVDLHLPAGSSVAVTGSEAAVRSALVSVLALAAEPVAGRLWYDGLDARFASRSSGMLVSVLGPLPEDANDRRLAIDALDTTSPALLVVDEATSGPLAPEVVGDLVSAATGRSTLIVATASQEAARHCQQVVRIIDGRVSW